MNSGAISPRSSSGSPGRGEHFVELGRAQRDAQPAERLVERIERGIAAPCRRRSARPACRAAARPSALLLAEHHLLALRSLPARPAGRAPTCTRLAFCPVSAERQAQRAGCRCPSPAGTNDSSPLVIWSALTSGRPSARGAIPPSSRAGELALTMPRLLRHVDREILAARRIRRAGPSQAS